MSDEQLSALIAKLKEDSALRQKLLAAASLASAVVIAKEAGYDVIEADWLRFAQNQVLPLSDQELESVSGGKGEEKDADETAKEVIFSRCLWCF